MRRLTLFIVVVVISLVFVGVTFTFAEDKTIAKELGYDGQWKQYPGTEITVCVEEVPMFFYVTEKLPEFEKLTGIKAKIEILPEISLRQKVLLDLAMQNGYYDVIGADMVDVSQYAKAGFLCPLDEFIENPKLTNKKVLDMDDFFENYMEGLTVDSKLYGFPTYIDGLMLMYRKDIFMNYGISSPPKTWEEYYEDAKKLTLDTNNDGKIDLYGTALRCKRGMNSNIYIWTSIFRSHGGEFFDKNMKPQVNSEAGIKATNYYVKLLTETAPLDIVNYGWSEVESAMEQGKVAMIIDAYDFPARMEDPSMSTVVGKLGYDVIPAGDVVWRGKKNIPSMYTLGVTISKYSKNKEAAWMFIKWITSKKLADETADKGAYSWLIRKSTLYSDKYKNTNATYWDALNQSIPLSDAHYRPLIPEWREVEDVLSVAISEVLTGTKTAKNALDGANETIFEIIKKAGYYKN